MAGQNTQLPLRTPQQMQGIEQLIGQLKGVNPDFSGIESYARRQFNTKTAPSIAERFTALGGSGTRNSGGLQGAILGAGSDLDAQLANLKSQYGLQQQSNLTNLLGMQTQENVYQPQDQGSFWSGAAPGIGTGLGLAGGLSAAAYAPSAISGLGTALGGIGAAGASAAFPPIAAILALLAAGYGTYKLTQ